MQRRHDGGVPRKRGIEVGHRELEMMNPRYMGRGEIGRRGGRRFRHDLRPQEEEREGKTCKGHVWKMCAKIVGYMYDVLQRIESADSIRAGA